MGEDIKNKKENSTEEQSEIKAKEENQPDVPGNEEVDASATEEGQVGEASAQENIEDVKAQLTNANDRYLRLMAEFDNFKKRSSREYERLIESANEKLMLELVEVRENFERALKVGETNVDFQSFYDGMKLIFTKFEEILQRNGLEAFSAEGDAFDPQNHDALMKAPNDSIPEDHIAQVFEKGYKLKGKVIKHAKVIVSSGKSA